MRIRLPERLSLVDLILWGLRVAIIVFVSVGTYATLTEGTLQGTDWRDLVVYGIAQGSVYALIALGYTLVYGVLFMINFAHGDVFMAGAMTAFFVADYFGVSFLELHHRVAARRLERLMCRPTHGCLPLSLLAHWR